MLRRLFERTAPYWLWALLALPAFGMLNSVIGADDPRIYHQLVHPSGEFAARFMIVAMMASPLALVFRGARFPRWLVRNRRYFGVAAFGYAALHLAYYLIDAATVARVMADLPKLYIWTGWLAFAIFIPLAATSMDYFVRKMGTWWKWLQRWTYAAAVLTLLHWAALHDWGGTLPALVQFGPLIGLSAYRAWYWYLRPRSPKSQAA